MGTTSIRLRARLGEGKPATPPAAVLPERISRHDHQAAVVDITKRYEAELAARDARIAELEALLDGATAPVAAVAPEPLPVAAVAVSEDAEAPEEAEPTRERPRSKSRRR
jgi:hypothetical protein